MNICRLWKKKFFDVPKFGAPLYIIFKHGNFQGSLFGPLWFWSGHFWYPSNRSLCTESIDHVPITNTEYIGSRLWRIKPISILMHKQCILLTLNTNQIRSLEARESSVTVEQITSTLMLTRPMYFELTRIRIWAWLLVLYHLFKVYIGLTSVYFVVLVKLLLSQ